MQTQSFLEDLVEIQKESIDYFFDHLNVAHCNSIFEKMQISGTLFTTGVGKSAFIAKKIAQMLISIGCKASFLSPEDAMHGDLGILDEKDCVILFSKSGSTKELLDLMPFLNKKGVDTVAICSHAQALLSQRTTYSLILPLKRELCPFDLAPTTSASLQMLFGDLLVVWMMEKRNFTLDEYALNHPAGFIGKSLTLLVDEVMISKSLPLIRSNALFSEALVELTSKRLGCVLIVDENKMLLGIFTDGDLKRLLLQEEGFLQKQIYHFMTKNPKTIVSQTLAIDALKKMHQNPNNIITHFPVLKENTLIGLVRMQEIVASGLNI
ncbi:MAG: Arabinose 5-phosphate isomerase KdsD [Chlamydiae bacterium]|nr:Arabinose 5-phosphate isomerase KdsD [Chlamydiota bacterium]